VQLLEAVGLAQLVGAAVVAAAAVVVAAAAAAAAGMAFVWPEVGLQVVVLEPEYVEVEVGVGVAAVVPLLGLCLTY